MTRVAVVADPGVAASRFHVARLAHKRDVRSSQWKIRLPIVIELPCSPVGWVMAVVALVAEAAAMRVVVGVTGGASTVGIMKRGRGVATIARERGVGAEQREARDVVVEPNLGRPAGRHVAGGTAIAELSFVHVVRGMARAAISGQRLGEIASVARVAGKLPMAGRQREAGLGLVIEQHGIPVEVVVATTAIGAEAAFVRVVFAVAGIAVAATEIFEVGGAMTVPAVQTFMAADEGEARDGHVVEADLGPVCRAVTVCALGAVTAFVYIVVTVTARAGPADLGEIAVLMAGVTFDRDVPTREPEAGRAVVEQRVTPVVRLVAGAAVVAEMARVYVVLSMAADTPHRRFAMCNAAGMTLTAGHRRVGAEEGEVRQGMVERRLVEIDDIRVASFMLGMAARALEFFIGRQTTMKPRVVRNVFLDLGMTAVAELSLELIGQRRMTSRAVGFDIGVAFDDGSGHDQPLLDLGRGCRCREQR